MIRHLSIAALVLSAACASETTETETVEPVATTGGETETLPPEEHPMRTTTPVPVPQPAVAREDLSEALQQTWTGIEEVVAIRPPDGPLDASEAAIEEWANGPLTEWITTRQEATRSVGQVASGVPEEPVWERAVGAALFGYALEEFAADIRSSPVPTEIAEDPELLGIYVGALTESLRPVIIESVTNYAVCQQRLATLGDESEWLPWRAYCVQRGQEIIETYQLQAQETEDEGEAQAEEPGEV
ncbi:MAG: hypothetical protein JJ863_04020 [Deltaproteobacteria bacterium]|nr:hypothetical protein [Deltaproteobacteria bacterium]